MHITAALCLGLGNLGSHFSCSPLPLDSSSRRSIPCCRPPPPPPTSAHTYHMPLPPLPNQHTSSSCSSSKPLPKQLSAPSDCSISGASPSRRVTPPLHSALMSTLRCCGCLLKQFKVVCSSSVHGIHKQQGVLLLLLPIAPYTV